MFLLFTIFLKETLGLRRKCRLPLEPKRRNKSNIEASYQIVLMVYSFRLFNVSLATTPPLAKKPFRYGNVNPSFFYMFQHDFFTGLKFAHPFIGSAESTPSASSTAIHNSLCFNVPWAEFLIQLLSFKEFLRCHWK